MRRSVRLAGIGITLAAAEAILWRALILRYGNGGVADDLRTCAALSVVALGLPVVVGFVLGRRLRDSRRAFDHGAVLGVSAWSAVWAVSAHHDAMEFSAGFFFTAVWLLLSGMVAALVGSITAQPSSPVALPIDP